MEKVYIILTDLAKLRTVATTLNDVLPSINEFIDPEEYKMVRNAIRRWENKLEKSFECVKDTPDVEYEETKYTVGDTLIRNLNNLKWLCILISRDYENEPHNRYVWQATMMPIFESGLSGGKTTEYYEEDLDKLVNIGNVFAMMKSKCAPEYDAKIDNRLNVYCTLPNSE